MKSKWRILRLMLLLFSGMVVYPMGAVTHRALVFGLGEQQDPMWGKIHGDNDVYYVVQMLQSMGYTDICTLKNKQATKAAMVQAFHDLTKRCRIGDVVYIHYSGHGQLITDLNGDESYKWTNSHANWDESWIPYDAYMVYGPNDKGERHLSDDEIASFLHKIRKKIGKKGELVVVIDACHSGDSTCGENDECIRGVDLKFNIPKHVNHTDRERPQMELWRTVSACKPFQLSTEFKKPQVGKLTYALYMLGASAQKKNNAELEKMLVQFLEQHKSVIKQTPVVSGKK